MQSQLTAIDGIGDVKAKELIAAGVKSVDDLKLKKYDKYLTDETKYAVDYDISKQLSYDHAHNLIEFLRKHINRRFVGVGSYRRKRAIVKDIDILTMMKLSDCKKILEDFKPKFETSFRFIGAYVSGTHRMSAIIKFNRKYVRVDFFKTTMAELPFALLHHTGSKQFNIRVRAKAKSMGLKLNQYGLFDAKNQPIDGLKNERAVLKYLSVTYKTPETRND